MTDFLAVLDAVQVSVAMSFVVVDVFESAVLRRFHTSAEIKAVMMAQSEELLTFLAVEGEEAVVFRAIPQKKGDARFAVDQLKNPKSLVLRPGRMANHTTLLAGQIGTASVDPASLRLFSAFGKVVRKQFVKVKSNWVGPEALRLLDSGGRLAATLKGAPEYDLRR